MQSLQEITATRAALLLAENGLPMSAGDRVSFIASNDILVALHRLGLLDRETLDRLFSGNFMISTGVDLAEAECDEETLWNIAKHGIVSLSLNGAITSSGSETRLLLPRVVLSLHANSRFLRDLRHLDIGGCLPCEPFRVLPMLELFSSLESLVVSEAASLTNADLSAISSHHVNLHFLDISNCPNISDISSLRSLRQLEVLLMHGVHLNMEEAEIAETFRAWSKLREIDLSCTADKPGVDAGVVLLDELDANGGRPFWPHLRSIDLAGLYGGLRDIPYLLHRIQLFIDSHHQLASLSLLATPVSRRSISAADGRQLQLASAATATHAKRALALYYKAQRAPLAVRALKALLTHGFISSLPDEECLECSSFVMTAMRYHSSTEAVQEHGARCQFFLISEHTLLLTEVVRPIVDAMDYMRIIRIGVNLMVKRGGFIGRGFYFMPEYLDCLEWTELDQIAADGRVVPVLLSWMRSIIELNGDSYEIDISMKFLFYLSDGRPTLCRQVVENAGVSLAFRYALDSDFQKNRCDVLSLLAMLARSSSSVNYHLLRNEFIQPLFLFLGRPPWEAPRFLLRSRMIIHQFLAGYIISHLLQSPNWNDCEINKESASQQLTVKKWFGEEGGCERLDVLLHSKTLTDSGKQLATEILEAMYSPPVEP